MNRRSGEPKENLRRARDHRDLVELVDYLWLARCGVAKARIAADGSIKAVRLGDDGSLVEICIPKPTKWKRGSGGFPGSWRRIPYELARLVRCGICGLGPVYRRAVPPAAFGWRALAIAVNSSTR